MSYVNHCLVCEDLRPEFGGKASILGFFGVLPNVRLWVTDLKAPARQLVLLFTFSPQEIVLRIRPQITTPDRKRLIPEESAAMIQLFGEFPSNAAISLGGIAFPVPGKYTVELYVNDVLDFSESMQVFEGPAPETHSPRYLGTEQMTAAATSPRMP